MANLSEEQADEMQQVLDIYAQSSEVCNAWEQKFMADQGERWEKYGAGINMSPKQWEMLRKIRAKMEKGG